MNGFRLAIDYGSSNTVAMLRWPDGRIRPLLFDGSPLLPSAVYATPDGRLLVGQDAERAATLDAARLEPNPKRHIDETVTLLGDRSVTLVELIAATLGRVAEEARRAAGDAPAEVVLTYPAAWGAPRRGTLAQAAARAGLPAPTLVPEPVAAAAYFATVLGHRVPVGHLVVVYDLGAGTLDVSVVRRLPDGFEVLAVDGMADFGGLDLDYLVVQRLGEGVDRDNWDRLTRPQTTADQRYFRALSTDARAAKESLSRQPSAGVHLPLVDRDVIVTREEFEAAARPELTRAAELTARVMAGAGARADNLAGLFLVGGASRVPLASTTLHQVTGIAPTALEQPEIVVAEGALHAAGGHTTATWPSAPLPGPVSGVPVSPRFTMAGAQPSPPFPVSAMPAAPVSPVSPVGPPAPVGPASPPGRIDPARASGPVGAGAVVAPTGGAARPAGPIAPGNGPVVAPPGQQGSAVPAGARGGSATSRWWIPVVIVAVVLVIGVAAAVIPLVRAIDHAAKGRPGATLDATTPGRPPSPSPSRTYTAQPEYKNAPDPATLITTDEVKRYVQPVREAKKEPMYEFRENIDAYIWRREPGADTDTWTSLWIGVKVFGPFEQNPGMGSAEAKDALDNVGSAITVPGVEQAAVFSNSIYVRVHNLIVVITYTANGVDGSHAQLTELAGLVVPHIPKP